MDTSIKKRIYWSFLLLVSLFMANSIVSLITLNNNRKLAKYVSTITNPSLQSLKDFEDLLIASKMYTTNWVFLRANLDDKKALKQLHSIYYPRLKMKLDGLSRGWENKNMSDSLRMIFGDFERLLAIEKGIMSSLQKFKDYDDPVTRFEAERLVEDELLPRTSSLMSALSRITSYELNIRKEKDYKLNKSFSKLRMLVSVLAVITIFMGVFLSSYMTRKIINPINKIKHIINDLGKGITRTVNHKIENDEIGEMVRSVNNLSEKLRYTAAFAIEVGNRNFSADFAPLSPEDTLGIALIAMRDNIRSTDQKLNEAQRIAHIGNWERDLKTDKVNLSDEMFRILGLDPLTFDHNLKTILQLVHPEDVQRFKSIQQKYIDTRTPVDFEWRIVKNGEVLKILAVQSKVIVDNEGRVIKTFGIAQDITERKKSEEKLAEERELFRLVIENIPDQIYLKDTNSRFILCNMPVAINAGRTSQEDMAGKTDFDFLPEETAKQRFAEEQVIFQSGIPLINHEEYMQDKNTGKLIWSLVTKIPLKNNTGNVIGLIGINHDITGRKIAQERLELVNRELNILFNSIDEIFFSVDMSSLKVIQISATCEKVYGYKQSEFMANYRLWFDIIHPDDKHIVENEDEILRRGEQINNEYRIVRKDRDIRWVETKIIPTLDKEGNLVRVDGVTRDITQRKKAEVELNKSEERYRQIVETAQEGIWMIDEYNEITFVNKKMCEIIEYSSEEIMGKQIHLFVGEEGNNNIATQVEKRKQGISETYDVKFITKSGKPVWTSVSANPVFDDAGTYKGSLAMITDITKRKRDEELLQSSQLNLALNNQQLERKNKELEQFAYVASHDLQEPLRTTISFVEIFKQQYLGKLDAKADKYLNYIVEASNRMKVLIKDLLDFSRIGHNKDLELVDCSLLLENVIADIDKAIEDSRAEIRAERLPVLNGYATELKQLFQNLIINSIKFRKKDVPLKIHIAARRKTDYWQFAFTDNGIGIDEEHSERIFIIFQRLHTRTEYQGSGIGLAHCKKIVELHHGKIWVESTPNEGSTFYFTIHSKEKLNGPKIKLHKASY